MKIKIGREDRTFSELVRLKRPICEVCRRQRSTQVHHFRSRRHQSTRFDESNIVALCFGCHRKLHEDPHFAVEWMKRKLGDNKYDELVLKSNMIVKRNKSDKDMLNLLLNKELKELKGKENEKNI